MKKISLLCLIVALMASAALADGTLVPDSVITQAVMTQTWNTSEFWWTETHVVLGERDLGNTIEVYVVGQTAGYIDYSIYACIFCVVFKKHFFGFK